MFTALLDTCVLWPSLQRDVLLSFAAEGLYRPAWSGVILAELEYEQRAKLVRHGVHPGQATNRAAHLVQQMRYAFDDAEITGWEGLDGTYGLPDPDDEHVVAAAVLAGAAAIITGNIRDFPATRLPHGLETLLPAQFAATTVALDPQRALLAIGRIAGRTGRLGPPRTVDDILDILVERYHFDDAVHQLRGTTPPR